MIGDASKNYDAVAFQADIAVSRETLARLERYAALLREWQARINLVGPATLPDLWRRHFLDSAQLLRHLPESVGCLVDLGSGAGFPGLVLAILGVPNVHLVESDQRKVAFLRTVAGATGTAVTIYPRRIEALPRLGADVVTARALAPLASLVAYGLTLLGPGGVCLFLKGQQADAEVEAAAARWAMTVDRLPSLTDSSGVILRLSGLAPKLDAGEIKR